MRQPAFSMAPSDPHVQVFPPCEFCPHSIMLVCVTTEYREVMADLPKLGCNRHCHFALLSLGTLAVGEPVTLLSNQPRKQPAGGSNEEELRTPTNNQRQLASC